MLLLTLVDEYPCGFGTSWVCCMLSFTICLLKIGRAHQDFAAPDPGPGFLKPPGMFWLCSNSFPIIVQQAWRPLVDILTATPLTYVCSLRVSARLPLRSGRAVSAHEVMLTWRKAAPCLARLSWRARTHSCQGWMRCSLLAGLFAWHAAASRCLLNFASAHHLHRPPSSGQPSLIYQWPSRMMPQAQRVRRCGK